MASIADVRLRIVDGDEARIAGLRSFFARVYRENYALCDDSLLRWQFHRAPGSHGEWHIKLAIDDGDIVGCLGYVPLDISLAGRRVRAAWVINWMVDATRRQLGLGPLLMREVMQQFDVTLNIGPNRVARELLTRMGWWSAGDLPRHVAILDRDAAAALAEDRLAAWPASASATAHDGASTARISRVERFDASVTSLWERLTRGGTGGLTGTARTAEFLNWRYADHPRFPYRLFVCHRGTELVGVAVYRVETVQGMPSVRVARLVEYLEATEDAEGQCSALLAFVMDEAQLAGVAVMDFFGGDRQLADRLRHHGFVADRAATSAVPIVFQPIDRFRTGITFMAHARQASALEAPQWDALNWYVTKGDGDQDRPN